MRLYIIGVWSEKGMFHVTLLYCPPPPLLPPPPPLLSPPPHFILISSLLPHHCFSPFPLPHFPSLSFAFFSTLISQSVSLAR